MARLLLRVPEVAEMLGLGRSLTYELVGSGAIASVRVHRCLRVPVAAVEQYVNGLTTNAAVEATGQS
jgi:excisionase family DNA binding protein